MPTTPQFAAAVERVRALPHQECAICRADLDALGKCSRQPTHIGTLPDPDTIAEAKRIYRAAGMGELRFKELVH